jgi:hypothetical protein
MGQLRVWPSANGNKTATGQHVLCISQIHQRTWKDQRYRYWGILLFDCKWSVTCQYQHEILSI